MKVYGAATIALFVLGFLSADGKSQATVAKPLATPRKSPLPSPSSPLISPNKRSKPLPTKTLPPRPAVFRVYRKSMSRDLFAACDANADDRISLFEALDSLGGRLNRSVFHRELDKNRNGFVTFEEFDSWFKTQSAYGGAIVLAPKALSRSRFGISRLLELPPALQRFFGLLDLDLDERISPKEWAAVKPLLGKRAEGFSELDKDLSGYLSMRELKPLLPLLVVFDKALRSIPAPKLRPLPPEMAGADLNADTRLDAREIKRALGRISPFLVRHSARVLRDADRDGDGSLSGPEVR